MTDLCGIDVAYKTSCPQPPTDVVHIGERTFAVCGVHVRAFIDKGCDIEALVR